MTGTVLVDRYLLGAVLGQSGLGLVHAAVDLKLRRDVAVKLLGSASADSEQLRRLSREALAAGSLQHPHHWLLPALIGLRMESRRDRLRVVVEILGLEPASIGLRMESRRYFSTAPSRQLQSSRFNWAADGKPQRSAVREVASFLLQLLASIGLRMESHRDAGQGRAGAG